MIQDINIVNQGLVNKMDNDFSNSYKNLFFSFMKKKAHEYSSGNFNELKDKMEKLSQAIFEENKSLIVDEYAEFHLFMTSLVLASYNVLMEKTGDDEKVCDIILYAFMEPSRNINQSDIGEMFKNTDDPFSFFVQYAKDKETNTYGKTFVFEYERDDNEAMFQNVTRCFYKDFFDTHNVPRLTSIFCSYDSIWMDHFKDGKFGFTVQRPTAMGEGDDICRFRFVRNKG